MARIQSGTIYEASGSFYVRYVTGTTLSKSGKPRPVQRSHRLCAKDDRYYSSKAKAVKLLAQEFMLTINRQEPSVGEDMSIAAFWEQRYLPYCEEVIVGGRPRKKPSTVRGYRQIWAQHLKAHFGTVTLQQYQARQGTALLQRLTATQRETTLRHISALASTIFSYAVVRQHLRSNPWADVVFPADAVAGPRVPHYSWAEAEDMITALVDRVDCQLIVALACFLGMRASEIAALRWEDVDQEWLHIRRAYVNHRLDVPKTQESTASIPLVDRVRVPLELWRQRSSSPSEGWLFPSGGALQEKRIIAPEMRHFANGPSPVDLQNLMTRVVAPCLKSEGLNWRGLRSGRPGAITEVIERSGGNAALAQGLARHKLMSTTTDVYKRSISPAALLNGMKLLEK
jgi:integrase